MAFGFQAPAETRRPGRQRWTRERVRESIMGRLVMFLCSVFLTLLLIAGVIVFVLWLSLRPHRPRFYVSSFVVGGLNPSAGLQNPTVSFDVSDQNPNRKIAIRYDAMNASVFYMDRQIGAALVQFPFYQPPKNTTVIHGELAGASLTAGDELWSRFATDVGNGRVEFRLELESIIRFELSNWGDTHNHDMHVSCDVAVGSNGTLVAESKDTRCSIYFG